VGLQTETAEGQLYSPGGWCQCLPSGKWTVAEFAGQNSAKTFQAPREVLKQDPYTALVTLTVSGTINGRACNNTADTGSNIL